MIIPSQPSQPDLRGYIDPHEPHSINNLIVQFLGNEEVVATVRDDGDVEAVLVRHIVQAIERRAEPVNTFGTVADEVRPIFQGNVGISAWGLAIHSQARIIAVSSNRHEVTVFRFALLDEVDNRESGKDNQQDSPSAASERNQQERKTDVTHQVLNGESNIPYISFCNTGDDPNARWLLTTDISGVCRVMDLHQVAPVQAFRFGPSFIGPHSGGYDRLNAGWAIMFLDRRSFQPTNSVHTALGLEESESLPDQKQDNRIWDASRTISSLSDTAEALLYNEPKKREQRLRSPRYQSPSQPVTPEQNISSPQSPDSISPDDPGGVPLDLEALAGDEEMTDTSETQDASHVLEEALGTVSQEGDSYREVVDDDDDLDDEGTEDTISINAYYDGKRICGNKPQFVRQTDLCENLPCPILHASVRNVYLLQPSNQRYHSGPFAPPLVGLAQPLQQSVQVDYRYLNMFDRLNMNAYMPALGVVILASQKGRALVLALTKVPSHVHYPKEMHDLGFKTNYALRAEAILPFAHQEKVNERPFFPLHGIAVGPMQGTETLPDELRRWRLMMMYHDHSVMSYEISRKRGRDSAIYLDSLVV